MREFTSSVLIVSEKPPADSQLQIDHIYRLSDLSPFINLSDSSQKSNFYFSTLILPLLVAISDEAEKYIHALQHLYPQLQIILYVHKNTMENDLINFLNKQKVFHILNYKLLRV